MLERIQPKDSDWRGSADIPEPSPVGSLAVGAIDNVLTVKEFIDGIIREAEELSPEKVFYYIYGVLYSNIYRKKYEEFLQIDFPRVPFTSDYQLFQKVSQLGKQLVKLHLLESPLLSQPEAKYPAIGTDRVEMREYQEKTGTVFINSQQYF
ncbi:unnamed protein product, partial [marine sediment metagenome]